MCGDRETQKLSHKQTAQRGARKRIVVKVVIPEMKQWLHNTSTFVLEFAISRKHPM